MLYWPLPLDEAQSGATGFPAPSSARRCKCAFSVTLSVRFHASPVATFRADWIRTRLSYPCGRRTRLVERFGGQRQENSTALVAAMVVSNFHSVCLLEMA